MKIDIGNMNFRTYYAKPYMLSRWAYTTKKEADKALEKAKEFSAKYRRSESNVIIKDKIKSGVKAGHIIYTIGTRGNR